MTRRTLKIIGLSTLTVLMTSGMALAGEGKDCDSKKMKTKIETTAKASTDTAVLSTAAQSEKMQTKKAVYSFEKALKLCQEKGVDDLQTCIDYKTGKTKPQT